MYDWEKEEMRRIEKEIQPAVAEAAAIVVRANSAVVELVLFGLFENGYLQGYLFGWFIHLFHSVPRIGGETGDSE